MQNLARGLTGGRLVGLENRVKDIDSLRGKVAKEMGDSNRSVEAVLTRVKVGLRYTIVADASDYVRVVKEGARAAAESGLTQAAAPKITWSDPDRYAGVNTTWIDPETSERVEVQFHTPERLAAKEQEHPLYEEKRRLDAEHPRYAKLAEEAKKIYRTVPRPRDVAELTLHLP